MTRHRMFPVIFALFALSSLSCTSFLKGFAYEGIARDSWQFPELIIDALDIRQGEYIADIEAGNGYFTFRLANAAGPFGKVYAVDDDPEMNGVVKRLAKASASRTVEVVTATSDDPMIPDGGVDLIFASNAYRSIEDPVTYFSHARKYLRKNGRVAIIDFHRDDVFRKALTLGHSTSREAIREAMEAAGYHLEHEYHFLPLQSFHLFSVGGHGDLGG